MKKDNRSIYMKRYFDKLRGLGWRNYSWLVPDEVGEKLGEYRKLLMREYKIKHPELPVNFRLEEQ